MKNHGAQQRTNQSVIIPNNRRLAAWLACALVGATVLTSSATLQFNGTNSYATMNQSFLGGATVTNFTIEFWTKNKRPEVEQNLCGKVEYWKEWMIGFPSGGRISFYHAWPNTYCGITTTNGVMKSNQWQHVAVVGQGTLGSIYVDGALVQQANSLRGQISFNAAVSGTTIAGFVLGFRDNATLPDDLCSRAIWRTSAFGILLSLARRLRPCTALLPQPTRLVSAIGFLSARALARRSPTLSGVCRGNCLIRRGVLTTRHPLPAF